MFQGGAQHTVVSLFGLVFGMWFARVANASPVRIWTAYVSLTIVHLVANYIAMRTLALRSLNRNRMGEYKYDSKPRTSHSGVIDYGLINLALFCMQT